jgi:hypothetical protein
MVYYTQREVEYYRQPGQQRWFPFRRDAGRRHLPLNEEIQLAVTEKDPILIVTNDIGVRDLAAIAPFEELRRFESVQVLRLKVGH